MPTRLEQIKQRFTNIGGMHGCGMHHEIQAVKDAATKVPFTRAAMTAQQRRLPKELNGYPPRPTHAGIIRRPSWMRKLPLAPRAS
ncbi:MAG: hypothetical protein HN948_00310 [Clostridia bacterium]|nr:hypothetical protein [Clostridia bacterium]MBT7121430.1 hypothetical protein [Clostridia bacterium]